LARKADEQRGRRVVVRGTGLLVVSVDASFNWDGEIGKVIAPGRMSGDERGKRSKGTSSSGGRASSDSRRRPNKVGVSSERNELLRESFQLYASLDTRGRRRKGKERRELEYVRSIEWRATTFLLDSAFKND
jgi:hypothetical protein